MSDLTAGAGSPPQDAEEPWVDTGRAGAVLGYLVRQLVDDPSAVHIDATEGRRGIGLSLRVGPGDMGRVIGRRGRVAQAIRTVVRAAGSLDGTEVSVDIVD